MVEVTIDSIRVSLMSQHRIVILKDIDSERYLTIWIGSCEADAITVKLQDVEVARPMTHDLLKTMLDQMNANVAHIVIRELRNDVFYAYIVIDRDGQEIEIDSRPSDALALAVRLDVPIFVENDVMDEAAITPENDVTDDDELDDIDIELEDDEAEDDTDLSAFADFMDSLDLDDLGDDD